MDEDKMLKIKRPRDFRKQIGLFSGRRGHWRRCPGRRGRGGAVEENGRLFSARPGGSTIPGPKRAADVNWERSPQTGSPGFAYGSHSVVPHSSLDTAYPLDPRPAAASDGCRGQAAARCFRPEGVRWKISGSFCVQRHERPLLPASPFVGAALSAVRSGSCRFPNEFRRQVGPYGPPRRTER